MPSHAPATRRQRLRDATTDDILTVARSLVAEQGAAGLSLRAVARTMEIAPSALYRYFPSRDALLTALIVQAYDSLGDEVEEAVARPTAADVGSSMLSAVHAFRSWALAHPNEFGLLYGTPVPGYVAPEDTSGAAMRTPVVLLGLLRRALDEGAVVLPVSDEELPEQLTGTVAAAVEHKDAEFSPTAFTAAMQFWAVLLGLVAGQVFCHFPPSIAEDASFFDWTCRRALIALGARADLIDAAVSPTL